MKFKRTHNCGQLRVADTDSQVSLAGWVANWRDHGGLVFIDLRDRYGITQVVFNPERAPEAHAVGRALRSEFVLAVRGQVQARPEGMTNPNIPTGEIEVYVDEAELLARSDNLPFDIDQADEVSLDVRLRHRYLDLRRPAMQRNLVLRHQAAKTTRDYLTELGFLEIETPFLTKSTPEGARDYLVPSRVHPGHFYALPQSPQLFKQILMIAGFDRYFQIVRCFRDEDLRAQRQPEFTQIDLEMSFVDENDVMAVTEGLLVRLFRDLLGIELPQPFPRLPYAEAMARYGTDKPDLRFGMELRDVTDIAADCEFKVFRSVAESDGIVRGLCVPQGHRLSRKEIDELTQFVGQFGARGLAWFRVEAAMPQSSIAKFFTDEQKQAIVQRLEAADGDLLLFVAAEPAVVHQALDQLRRHLAWRLGMVDRDSVRPLWVVDFPMFEYSPEQKRPVSLHHPFTMVVEEDLEILEPEPLKARSRAYDVVINGIELGGGSIRIHDTDVQKRIFKLLGIADEEAEARFGFLLEALRYGAPPHGGLAFGFDRLVAMMLRLDDIRETIAFPKTQRAVCPLTSAPSPVDERQLRELGIALRKKSPLKPPPEEA
jgi:aspartyl-tRNA synthetase